MSTRITVERDGHVLMIGINRPEKRNAFDLESLDALAAAYERPGTDGARSVLYAKKVATPYIESSATHQ